MNYALAALADALANDENASEDTKTAAKLLLEAVCKEQDLRLHAAEVIGGM